MQTLTSPTKYIKTKARQCPIYKCWINEGWDECGIAEIVVSRKMPSGKFIVGLYLVDLYARGLTRSGYFFNVSEWDLDEMIDEFIEKDIFMEEAEYPLVHNIVFEGIIYGDSLQFKPHKDFELTKFILEEDTEDIEEIKIECGFNGKPAVVSNPSDSKIKIIEHLNRVVGKNGFTIINEGYDEDDLNSEYPDDELSDEEDAELEERINNMPEEKLMEFANMLLGYSPLEKKINELYLDKFPGYEVSNISEEDVFEEYNFIHDDQNEYLEWNQEQMSCFELEIDYEYFAKCHAEIISLSDTHLEVEDFLEMIEKEPENPYWYVLLTLYLTWIGQNEDAANIAGDAVKKFPSNLDVRLQLAQYYLMGDHLIKFSKLFYRGFDLRLYTSPGKRIFRSQFCFLLSLLSLYFCKKNQLATAEYFINKASAMKKVEHLLTITEIKAYIMCVKAEKLFGDGYERELDRIEKEVNAGLGIE